MSLGELQAVSREEVAKHTPQDHYDVIVVDAATVEDVPSLVSHLRAQWPAARVVVATASPTWKRAREALQAGAVDYIRKSLSEKEILSVFRDILSRTPPPWPQPEL
jgi:DNA-binding NarL/FixJ family response regulator